MVDPVFSSRWKHRLMFVGLVFLVAFGRLLPLDGRPGGWPGPDLVLLLTYAFVVRRPDAVPILLVAAVVLMTDVLFMRPLALWTACVILGLEFLRNREHLTRDLPFLGEWMMVAGTILAVTVLNTVILSLFGVIRPTLGQVLIQMIVTILVYPFVVFFTASVLGIRKMVPGAVDQLGRRL